MLSVASTVPIFLCTQPTDLRKGFDGLSGIVRGAFGADPLDGSLYLFINRRRDRIKILHFDDIVGTDDTHVTLLLPETIPKPDPDDPKSQRAYEVLSKAIAEKRRSVTARMWAYRGITVPLNVFDFTVSWHRDGPETMLADFRGILQADCYAGYEGIALGSEGRIRRASCVAHARRKVFDAKESYPLESAVVLAKFQELYDIEDQAKALSPEDRWALRQSAAVPVWEELEAWLDSESATRALPKSPLGKALGYLRNHWKPLQTYWTDGRIPIDNNDVEQLMKQVALGRKNSYDLLSRTQRRKTPLQSTWKGGPGRPAARDPVGRRSPCSSEASGRRPIGWAAGRACGRAPRGPSSGRTGNVVSLRKERSDRHATTIDQTPIRGLATP